MTAAYQLRKGVKEDYFSRFYSRTSVLFKHSLYVFNIFQRTMQLRRPTEEHTKKRTKIMMEIWCSVCRITGDTSWRITEPN